MKIEIKTAQDWFDIYAKVQFGDYEIPFINLKRHILNGIREFELPNGEVAILPNEWFVEYTDLLSFVKADGMVLKLKKYHYKLLQKSLKGIDTSFFKQLGKLGDSASKPVVLPATIQAKLRSYQEEGFSWMYHLYENQFGGCLADDMGLGKTLQTLTLLLKLKRMKKQALPLATTRNDGQLSIFSDQNTEEESDKQPASLIVMPTSLIHNWENEIKKFTPSLKTYKYIGAQRKSTAKLNELISFYGYCGMSEMQKHEYEKEKSIIRNAILQNIEKEGLERSAIVVLQGLTKLRQLANHPSMLNGDHDTDSGKFDEIFSHLENLMAEKHKVLIFSSFVKHLELLKQKIEANKWKYSLLTGRTTKREEVIKNFQEDPENRIFLISLKAGGVGLNLTSADYVFIIDPWWNPASENQAINRAHRIGQDKKVFVYRFITEGSIEEKIQLLKERKSSLAEKFIHSNNPFKAISQEEILGLLE